METYTVSVIIPTYNRESKIVEAIKSVKQQTYKDIEIIVCDDGSTDNTKNVIARLQKKDKRIKFITGKHTGLPAITRNKGLKVAKGEWVAFLDDDDVWDKDKLLLQAKIINTKKCDVVCSNAISSKTKKKLINLNKNGFLRTKELLKNNLVICSSVLAKKKALEIVGGFSESKKMKAIEDYDLWLRISTDRKIYFLNKNLVYYNDDPEDSIRKDGLSAREQKNRILFFYVKWLVKDRLKKLFLLN